jgi:SAM-dependent methyltransferase
VISELTYFALPDYAEPSSDRRASYYADNSYEGQVEGQEVAGKGKNMKNQCLVCDQPTQFYGRGIMRMRQEEDVLTDFFLCKECNTFYRKIKNENLMSRHFDKADYNQIKWESEYWEQRKGFYNFLIDSLNKHVTDFSNQTVFDIGCSYGHFLKICKQRGANNLVGVEINSHLRQRVANSLAISTYPNLDDTKGQADTITFIDSFYYFDNPNKILDLVRKKLKDNGTLLLRITNRSNLLKLINLFKKTKDCTKLGDATISYSLNSIKKVLAKNGFSIQKILYYEKGKGNSTKKLLIYLFLYCLTMLSFYRVPLTSGLIIIAKKV